MLTTVAEGRSDSYRSQLWLLSKAIFMLVPFCPSLNSPLACTASSKTWWKRAAVLRKRRRRANREGGRPGLRRHFLAFVTEGISNRLFVSFICHHPLSHKTYSSIFQFSDSLLSMTAPAAPTWLVSCSTRRTWQRCASGAAATGWWPGRRSYGTPQKCSLEKTGKEMREGSDDGQTIKQHNCNKKYILRARWELGREIETGRQEIQKKKLVKSINFWRPGVGRGLLSLFWAPCFEDPLKKTQQDAPKSLHDVPREKPLSHPSLPAACSRWRQRRRRPLVSWGARETWTLTRTSCARWWSGRRCWWPCRGGRPRGWCRQTTLFNSLSEAPPRLFEENSPQSLE